MRLVKASTVSASVGALLLASASPVQAQVASTVPGATRVSEAGTAERNDLNLAVISRYDSNIARIGDEQLLAQRGYTREDIRVSPGANLYVTRNLGRHQIGLRSYLGYDFYTRNERLNRERISVEPYVYLNLPVCDLTVEGHVARLQSELGDVILLSSDQTITLDNVETRKRINGRVVCGDSYGLRPTFEADYSTGSNSSLRRRVANYEATRLQPGVGYASPALGEISIYAIKQDTELPNRFLASGGASGFSMRGFGASYRRNIGTRLNFNGSVSFVDVTPNGGTRGSRSGINGNIALTVLASERLQIAALASRAFNSSLTGFSLYDLSQSIGVTVNYAANDRLRFRAGGLILKREFVYAETPPPGSFIGRQTRYNIFAGTGYDLNRRLRLSADVGAQKRDADLNQFDYNSVYASIGLALSF